MFWLTSVGSSLTTPRPPEAYPKQHNIWDFRALPLPVIEWSTADRTIQRQNV
jgi:hypothetical protein